MDLPVEALVINLVRRVDRLVFFKKSFPFRSRTVDACDGSILSDQLQVNLLSSGQLRMVESLKSWVHNPAPMIPGIFGCWQSHILIWNELADSLDQSKKYLVLEDDAIPTRDIHLILPKVLNCLPEDFDLAFLGGQDTPNYTRPQNQFEHSIEVPCSDGCDLSWNRLTSAHLNTTSAYVITKRGARSLLELLASHLDNCEPLPPIDHFIRISSDTLENYEVATHIFNSPWDSPESDIRFPGFHDKETPTYLKRSE